MCEWHRKLLSGGGLEEYSAIVHEGAMSYLYVLHTFFFVMYLLFFFLTSCEIVAKLGLYQAVVNVPS